MSHDASHAADTDERHIVGDIIAHLLIGAWLASVGVNLLLRSINSRRISSAFNTPKSALFPSASGACFWLFLAGYQIAIALVRGLDHIEMTLVLSCSFGVQYMHATGRLNEAFWIIAEPVGLCSMAVMFGVRNSTFAPTLGLTFACQFMHSQHSVSDAAYHRITGTSIIVLGLVRLASLWYASSAVHNQGSDAAALSPTVSMSEPNPIYRHSRAKSNPLLALGGYLYVINGLYMADIALTPYMRPSMVEGLDAAGMAHFAQLRLLRLVFGLLFVFAAIRLFITRYEQRVLASSPITEEEDHNHV